jgi:two-component system sensor histidine kinase PilS (NtrC family)
MNTNRKLFDSSDDLQRQLQWLMLCRVIVASFFLGVAVIAQLQRSGSYLAPYLMYLYGLTASVYCITIIYVVLILTISNFKFFAYAQIMADIMLITVLVFITGGINSIFSFMYSISIISASILLYRFGGLLAATTASFCYTFLLNLEYNKIIHPLQISPFVARGYAEEPLVYPIIINITAFYLVAILSSFISEQARKSRMQLKEQQIDIKTLEALNERIIQSINSGLLTIDLKGNIISFNRAAEQITGYGQPAVLQRHIEEVFTNVISTSDSLPEQKTDPVSSRFELSFTRSDGKVLRLGFSSSTLKDGTDNEIGKILVFQDLTLLKAMEEYVKRMDRLAAIGRLAAGIAHEVRNPLASISGSVQVLQKGLQLSESDRRLMDIILRESNNLNQLISNFIQFARPNTQKKELVYFKHLVDETLQLFNNSPECSDSITITCDIEEDLCFEADPQQLKQVMWNLLINAAQAMNNDGGHITIAARCREEGSLPDIRHHSLRQTAYSCHVEIAVQDTGCGLEDTDTDKIFEPFYSTKEHGTGLGLSIVHRIIEDLGGTISVTSTQGNGACFTITIPQQTT